MSKIYLIEGPVGAGKSTFGLGLSQRLHVPCLILDVWMANLFRPDRPETDVMTWYGERKDRCIQQIWKIACAAVDCGSDAIVELGLITRESRELLYAQAEDGGYDFALYVLEPSREIRRERVIKRNLEQGETFAVEVPPAFFEMASDMWEPLSEDECRSHEVIFI